MESPKTWDTRSAIDDEGSMIVAADGKTAYYSSDRSDTRGGLDIYTFELRQDLRPLEHCG